MSRPVRSLLSSTAADECGSVRWAELAVTCIAETGHDERMLVEVTIDRCGDDVQIHPRGFEVLDSLRGREHARNEDGVTRASIHENLAAVSE